ncbi:hypothetical protein DN069_20830 [Streptacidiphilus pinicola]|uniref:Uncharacterized protein n=1 Tax=Streptacidiphilus pinicola TaxID=2219663 RepID=A0A2X0IJY4_9ACTN|nr:hypothetical protein [Streptacidiphilus pinicola]RAG83701.1 hypothetical protein DN069_20830 [Streptacidiphilus pinicola]
MSLAQAQTVLLKLYLDKGYRLAHRSDPALFAERMGLDGTHAGMVSALSPDELDDFATTLVGKRWRLMKPRTPKACEWIENNDPGLVAEFAERYPMRPGAPSESQSLDLVAFLRDCADFDPEIPGSLADVAEFELMLGRARVIGHGLPVDRSEVTPGQSGLHSEFAWDSLVWVPRRTAFARFSHDVVGVVSGSSPIDSPEMPQGVVVSARANGVMPRVLRVPDSTLQILESIQEPTVAERIAGATGLSPVNIRRTLVKLSDSEVIDSAYIGPPRD